MASHGYNGLCKTSRKFTIRRTSLDTRHPTRLDEWAADGTPGCGSKGPIRFHTTTRAEHNWIDSAV